MSSFCLILRRDGKPPEGSLLAAMAGRLSHRGPDGMDQLSEGPLALASLRFWTTPSDLGSRQPVRHRDGCRLFLWDGRIDNREELIEGLGLDPGPGQGHDDATLALRAYEAWGEACWERILGPWASAVCDPRSGRVDLTRDPVGDRSLFYHLGPTQLLVASEGNALLADPQLDRSPDRAFIARYLALAEPADGSTFFAPVTELLPGHRLSVDSRGSESRRWWQARSSPQLRYRREAEYTEHFLELLGRAVTSRLRSTTGPVLQMSGGLDSTSVAALASDAAGRPMAALSWVFGATKDCDESDYMRSMYGRYPLEPVHFESDRQVPFGGLEAWPVNPNAPEETVFRPMVQQMYQAAQERGSRVMLTGLYGDNLFLGGERWWIDLVGSGRLGPALLAGLREAYRVGPLKFSWRHLVRPSLPAWFGFGQAACGQPEWLTPEARALARPSEVWPPSAPSAQRPIQHQRTLSLMNSQATIAEQFHLRSHALDLRNPFRDRRLIEFMLAVPAFVLQQGEWSKAVLRRAMRGRLPAKLLKRRDKTSFAELYRRGMTEERRQRLWRRLTRQGSLWDGLVSREWLRKALWSDADPRPTLVLSRCVLLDHWARRNGPVSPDAVS